MIYLGTLDRMIGIKCPSSQQVQTEDRYSFQTTLEGVRKAQVKARGARTWSLGMSEATTASDESVLSQFAMGAWGVGPFWFVSSDAPVTNMLTPEVSTCGPAAKIASVISLAGPQYLGNGVYSARSLLNTDPGVIMYFGATRVPVVQGKRVTASAWVTGAGAAVRLFWYNAAGSLVSSNTSTLTATATTTVRSWVSAAPPADAVSCIVGAVSTSRASQPAITWSEALLPWAAGQGCPKAIVHEVSRSLVMATSAGVYGDLSFTVSEVG